MVQPHSGPEQFNFKVQFYNQGGQSFLCCDFCFLEGNRIQIRWELDTHVLKLFLKETSEYSLPIDYISHKERGKQELIRQCIGKEAFDPENDVKRKQNL